MTTTLMSALSNVADWSWHRPLARRDRADDVPSLVQPVERAVPDRQLPQLEVFGGPERAVAVGLLGADEPALHPQEVLVGVQRLLELGDDSDGLAVIKMRRLASVRQTLVDSGGSADVPP